jgi:small subunit ribosomal protein S17
MANQKVIVGTVTSDKMNKTIIVRTMHKSKHASYSRVIKRYNKFKAHDEKNSAKIGDIVQIVETRPLSKEKNFRLVKIIKKALAEHIEIKDEVIK